MNTRVIYLLIAMAAGCTPPAPPVAPRPMTISADPSEYAAFQRPGALELAGQAFLTTRRGDVKLAAGRLVTLDPATTYAKEWFRRFGADPSNFDAVPPNPAFTTARRTTIANAEGRFRFSGLPPGDYLLRTTVTWETGAAYAGLQGGVVAALVSVREGGTAEVILNQVYTPTLAGTLGVSVAAERDLASRPHRVIARITGVSCQVGLIDPPATEARAREELMINAARQEADAVARVECRRHGMSFRPNCTSRFVCEGEAIAWTM